VVRRPDGAQIGVDHDPVGIGYGNLRDAPLMKGLHDAIDVRHGGQPLHIGPVVVADQTVEILEPHVGMKTVSDRLPHIGKADPHEDIR
jgi:hypothetical protein